MKPRLRHFRLTINSTRNGTDLEISTGYCDTILTLNVGMLCVSAKFISVNHEVREKTNKMQQLDVYYQHFLNMFWAYYAHLQKTKMCVTARSVLRWFCWMWLVAVVGRCIVGCSHPTMKY